MLRLCMACAGARARIWTSLSSPRAFFCVPAVVRVCVVPALTPPDSQARGPPQLGLALMQLPPQS